MALIHAKAHVRPARAPRYFPTTTPTGPPDETGDWKSIAMSLARLAESYQVAYIESKTAFVDAMEKAGVNPRVRLLHAQRANVAHGQIERLLKDPEIMDAMNAVKRQIMKGSGILNLGRS